MFPATAIVTGSNGEVYVEIVVGKTGQVESAHLTRGHRLLQKSSEEAAKQWQFSASNETHTIILKFVFSLIHENVSVESLTAMFRPPYEVEVRQRAFKAKPQLDPISDDAKKIQRRKSKN